MCFNVFNLLKKDIFCILSGFQLIMSKVQPARVRVNVFSGRQNPEWHLSLTDTKTFLQLWEQAEAMDEAAEHESRLGYSGCTVHIGNKRWEVYRDIASLYEGNTIISKRDKGNMIEHLLLKQAPEEIRFLLD